MNVQIRKKLRRNRLSRSESAQRQFPISAFTLFIVLFSQAVHFFWVFSIASMPSFCHYAAFWTTGWFDFAAPYQWLGVSVIAMGALFGVRTALLSTHMTAPWETCFQGALVGAVSLVFLVQTAHLFPYAYPGAASVGRMFHAVSPTPTRVVEAAPLEWPYEFPEAPPNPLMNSDDAPQGWDVFRSSLSPTWREYEAMNACRVKYDEDLKAYLEWRQEFEGWCADNRLWFGP